MGNFLSITEQDIEKTFPIVEKILGRPLAEEEIIKSKELLQNQKY